MMIDIRLNITQLDDIVRVWLKDTLAMTEFDLSCDYLHPHDVKEYRKDIKAIKRLLEYVGNGEEG